MNEDGDAIAMVILLVSVLLAAHSGHARKPPQTRRPCLKRKRLDWEAHADRLEQTRRFERCYKMSRRAFNSLLELLSPALQVNEQQSRNRTGIDPITSTNKLQMFLRYMSGGSHHDIISFSGVSETAFYTAIEEVSWALVQHPELRISFPEDEEAQDRVVRGFTNLSNQGVMNGCVGAIDGWLCQIMVPSSGEVNQVCSFFSGHYRCYGVNVQACCDSHCRFTSVSISSPGSTGDAVAYEEWSLKAIADRLSIGRYLVGDNAYANGNRLLTPFPRPSIQSDYHDSFNFHLSQLRIRIEMAFGLLVRKWRIFRSPLQTEFANVSRIIMASCILHNWCINQRLQENPNYDIANDEILTEAIARLPPVRGAQHTDRSPYSRLYTSPEATVRRERLTARETNLVRNTIVGKLARMTLKRPHRSVVRRARNERG